MSIPEKTYAQKILFTGTQAAIDAATKTNDGLYFASDTQKLYKGSVDFTMAARFVTTMPATPVKSALYIVKDDSGNFVKAVATDANGVATDIAIKTVTSISSSSTDAEVATAKAVYDYVDSIVGGDTVVTEVAAATGSDNSGKVTVTKGDGSQAGQVATFAVPGVALKPTYTALTRTIQIPYTENGSDPAGTVTIDLGADLVVTEGRYNATAEQIEFWITGHSSQAGDPADIVVPVGDLVDEIQGGSTSTAVTTYTAATNTLTADVRVSGKAGNALSTLTGQATSSEDGLYVDLSDITTSLTNIQANVDAVYTAMTTWTVLTV